MKKARDSKKTEPLAFFRIRIKKQQYHGAFRQKQKILAGNNHHSTTELVNGKRLCFIVMSRAKAQAQDNQNQRAL